MVEALIALGAAVFGGAGLKIIESLLNRSKDKADFASQLRDELRVDIAGLREELLRVEEKLERSREMYYAVLHAFNMAKSHLIECGMNDEVNKLEDSLQRRTRGKKQYKED